MTHPMPRYGQPLTLRERQVLTDMRAGYDSSRIGAHLNLTTETIRSHRLRIYAKLGASNAAHAVALAYETHIAAVIMTTIELAARILATLPLDPAALAHRETLDAALAETPAASSTKPARILTRAEVACLTANIEGARHATQAGHRAATLACLDRARGILTETVH